jgi:hypothetical protein
MLLATLRLQVARLTIVLLCAIAPVVLGGCSPPADAVLVNKTDVRITVAFQLTLPRAIPPFVDGPSGPATFDFRVTDLRPGSNWPLDDLPDVCVTKPPVFTASLPDRPLKRKVRMGNKWCVKERKAPKWIIEYVP